MSNEKYYTPTIEEFYVGFECEIRNSSNEPFEWEKFKIIGVDDAEISGMKMDWSFYDSQNDIKENQIRVKYLDKEDIESLGFDSYGEWDKGIQFVKQISKTSFRNYIVIDIDNITNELTITGLMGFTPTGRTNGERLFRGKIKNKSELIKLLKQLGI